MTRTKDYAQFIEEAAARIASAPAEAPQAYVPPAIAIRPVGPTAVPTATSLPTDDKARKSLPIFTYITEYFPDALVEETRVAVIGNDQHNPGQPLHWAREKSKDQLNTAFRHMLDHKLGNVKDVDGAYHLAKAIWRLKAELQLTIERERNHGK